MARSSYIFNFGANLIKAAPRISRYAQRVATTSSTATPVGHFTRKLVTAANPACSKQVHLFCNNHFDAIPPSVLADLLPFYKGHGITTFVFELPGPYDSDEYDELPTRLQKEWEYRTTVLDVLCQLQQRGNRFLSTVGTDELAQGIAHVAIKHSEVPVEFISATTNDFCDRLIEFEKPVATPHEQTKIMRLYLNAHAQTLRLIIGLRNHDFRIICADHQFNSVKEAQDFGIENRDALLVNNTLNALGEDESAIMFVGDSHLSGSEYLLRENGINLILPIAIREGNHLFSDFAPPLNDHTHIFEVDGDNEGKAPEEQVAQIRSLIDNAMNHSKARSI